MNHSIYLFGELSEGYTQYPLDSSSSIFQHIKNHYLAPSQLIIHRDDNLMYYIYVRKFETTKYLGVAIVINGYFFTDIQPLFSIFENVIERLIENGVLIHLSTKGTIASRIVSLSNEEDEVISVINTLHNKLNSLQCIQKLPTVDFSFSITSQKLFKATDLISDITNASCAFAYTIVLKEEDFDSVRTTSFKNILKNLTSDKNALIKENEELKERNRKILRQKKQIRSVVILFLILIVCGFVLYCLNDNLNNTKSQLDSALNTIAENEQTIGNQQEEISELNSKIRSLYTDLNNEKIAKDRYLEQLTNLQKQVQDIQETSPFFVTNCQITKSYFKFDYISLEEKEIVILLTAANENSSEKISKTHQFTINKGNGSKTLFFNKALNTTQDYYVFLTYKGKIIAGKRW